MVKTHLIIVKIQHKIVLICSCYNCCVQTSMFHSFFESSGIRRPVSSVHAMNEYKLVWTDSTTKKHSLFFPTRYFPHQVAAHICAP